MARKKSGVKRKVKRATASLSKASPKKTVKSATKKAYKKGARARSKNKAPVFLWTGLGWGKTTSALGAAMRALGHGYKVEMIQFMKGRPTGEIKIADKLENYRVQQFGRAGWVDLNKPSKKDKELAKKGILAARQAAKRKPFLLILDEVNLAVAAGLVDLQDLFALLDEVPKSVNIYLTGRYAPPRLILRADYVNEVVMIKGPKRFVGQKGIDW